MRKKTKDQGKGSAHKARSPKFEIYPNPNFLLPTSILWVGIDDFSQKNSIGSYLTQPKIKRRKKVKSDD
jgi:hypothetical protein